MNHKNPPEPDLDQNVWSTWCKKRKKVRESVSKKQTQNNQSTKSLSKQLSSLSKIDPSKKPRLPKSSTSNLPVSEMNIYGWAPIEAEKNYRK